MYRYTIIISLRLPSQRSVEYPSPTKGLMWGWLITPFHFFWNVNMFYSGSVRYGLQASRQPHPTSQIIYNTKSFVKSVCNSYPHATIPTLLNKWL